jgi:hypothetical protein
MQLGKLDGFQPDQADSCKTLPKAPKWHQRLTSRMQNGGILAFAVAVLNSEQREAHGTPHSSQSANGRSEVAAGIGFALKGARPD